MTPSIGIIGGADGPTAILVSGGSGIVTIIVTAVVFFAVGILAGYFFTRKKK